MRSWRRSQQIQDSLRWVGIDWDGDVTFQLDTADKARELADRLLSEGKAYEDDGAIRFRQPKDGVVSWDDAVRGRIEFRNELLNDLVIIRSDGRPTYNFVSPVDDVFDGITHVIRAEDHVSNTPTQINILRALGADLPVYAHVPNINGDDGRKLSKRHGAISVDHFRNDGYLPQALMNFLALLGWSYDDKTTVMSRDELIERFSLERVVPSPATFDYKKLDWLNGVYLRGLQPDEYAESLANWLAEQEISWPTERVRATVPLVQEKIEKFSQYPDFVRFFFEPVVPPGGIDPEICRAAAERLAVGRAVGGRRDRGVAARPGGGARAEAARRLRTHPACGHRFEGLARALREHRAAGPRGEPGPARRSRNCLRFRGGRRRPSRTPPRGPRPRSARVAGSLRPTKARAPMSASAKAASGQPTPCLKVSSTTTARGVGAARRMRASRTRNNAPRHSWRRVSTPSPPQIETASATSAVASRAQTSASASSACAVAAVGGGSRP